MDTSSNTPKIPTPAKFTQIQGQFIQHLKQNGRATATILAYGKDIEQLLDFTQKRAKRTVSEISSEDIENFKQNLLKQNYTPKSVSRKLNSIKAFFRYLENSHQISTNPTAQIHHPKYDINPPRILSKTEYRALRDACRHDCRLSAIVEILLQTGIRIGELANLTLNEIELHRSQITIRAYESHQTRLIPLNNAAKASLADYLNNRPKTKTKTLFVTKTGRPFLVRNIRTAIDRFFKIAGIDDAKVNDLRHTFIAQQLRAGTPLVYVSKLAGHKRISTTEKYLKYINETIISEEIRIEEL